jgi:hypothetical protein
MARSVTIKANFGPLADLKLSSRELMKEIGLLARERIVRRTVSGRDERDAAFRPYSPGYAERKAREVGAGGVDLQLSGGMLNAITIVNLTDDSVTLGFSS